MKSTASQLRSNAARDKIESKTVLSRDPVDLLHEPELYFERGVARWREHRGPAAAGVAESVSEVGEACWEIAYVVYCNGGGVHYGGFTPRFHIPHDPS